MGDFDEVATLRSALVATAAERTASGVVQHRRRTPDGPPVGREFRGELDLVRWTARGTQFPRGWLRKRLFRSTDTWWEPRGSAVCIGGRWTSFVGVMPLEDSPMPPSHPLFLMGALPHWLSADANVHTLGERAFAVRLDVGMAMFPRAFQVPQDDPPLRWIEAYVRLDPQGRIITLAHAFAKRAGGRLNRWHTTELLAFGCETPVRPPGLDPPAP